jgi:hypothetical protein
MIFILGIRKREEKMRKKKRKDKGYLHSGQGKRKNENKKMILTLCATETREEKSKYNLSTKGGSLFCFVVRRSTKPGCFRLCSWCLWKALDEEGHMGLVP